MSVSHGGGANGPQNASNAGGSNGVGQGVPPQDGQQHQGQPPYQGQPQYQAGQPPQYRGQPQYQGGQPPTYQGQPQPGQRPNPAAVGAASVTQADTVGPGTAPTKGKWWSSKLAVGLGSGLLGLMLGSAAGGGGGTAALPAQTTTVTATTVTTAAGVEKPGATVTAVKTVEATKQVTVTAPPPGPAVAFGDGMYEVGKDIKPGTYRATGEDCYWARLSSADGELESILANGNGPVIVTIKATDKYFDSRRCGDWVKR